MRIDFGYSADGNKSFDIDAFTPHVIHASAAAWQAPTAYGTGAQPSVAHCAPLAAQ